MKKIQGQMGADRDIAEGRIERIGGEPPVNGLFQNPGRTCGPGDVGRHEKNEKNE
jgi:hypothetical protein